MSSLQECFPGEAVDASQKLTQFPSDAGRYLRLSQKNLDTVSLSPLTAAGGTKTGDPLQKPTRQAAGTRLAPQRP